MIGMYLDIIVDAKEDAEKLEGIKPHQLVTGALRKIFALSSRLKIETIQATVHATHDYGVDRHFLKKPLKAITSNSRLTNIT